MQNSYPPLECPQERRIAVRTVDSRTLPFAVVDNNTQQWRHPSSASSARRNHCQGLLVFYRWQCLQPEVSCTLRPCYRGQLQPQTSLALDPSFAQSRTLWRDLSCGPRLISHFALNRMG